MSGGVTLENQLKETIYIKGSKSGLETNKSNSKPQKYLFKR